MAANKTIETGASVDAYLESIGDEKRKTDCSKLIKLISKATGFKPKMWGPAIVGFGSYHYKYESGREGDAPLVAMSCRVNAIVLYLAAEFKDKEDLLSTFGKYKIGKGCIYIQNLEDIDTKVLTTMVNHSVLYYKTRYAKA